MVDIGVVYEHIIYFFRAFEFVSMKETEGVSAYIRTFKCVAPVFCPSALRQSLLSGVK